MNKKAIVLGSAGQLGVELCREFEKRNWTVQGFRRQDLDITNAAQTDAAIDAAEPAVVLNAAAYNLVDVAENEPLAAYQVNSLAVRNLALACRHTGAQLVHYSTDYVFDGTKGAAYLETDATHPVGAYGVSKLAGELYAQAYLDNALILRTSGVFGPGGMFTPRGNFLELMLRLAREGKPIRVVQDFIASPTYAPAIAARTADALERGLHGVYHLGGGEAISWFDYATTIFQLANVSPALEPTTEKEYRTVARRPKYSVLSNSKLEAAGIAPMPRLRAAVEEYLALRDKTTAHRSV